MIIAVKRSGKDRLILRRKKLLFKNNKFMDVTGKKYAIFYKPELSSKFIMNFTIESIPKSRADAGQSDRV